MAGSVEATISGRARFVRDFLQNVYPSILEVVSEI